MQVVKLNDVEVAGVADDARRRGEPEVLSAWGCIECDCGRANRASDPCDPRPSASARSRVQSHERLSGLR